jgi:pimeloyl-ACP methyl ester carboxylesterase
MTIKLSYEILGEGKPLVCLHAYALDHAEWMDVAKILEPRATLILPDIRGHGGSPSPEGEYSMKELGADVIAILDHLKINNASFAGHSMGGYVALSITRNFPDRVSGLALVASHAYADSPEKSRSRWKDIERVREQGPQEVLANMPENLSNNTRIQDFCRQKVEHMDENGVIVVLAAMANRDGSIQFLKNFKKPLGIIVGTEDHFIPLKMSREMADVLQPQVYVEIENCGHMPMMEAPDEVAEAIASLFDL